MFGTYDPSPRLEPLHLAGLAAVPRPLPSNPARGALGGADITAAALVATSRNHG